MTNKQKSLILSLTFIGALVIPAQAYQSPDAEATPAPAITAPTPTRVVQPGVDPSQVGRVVTLRFTVDAFGKPMNVRPASARQADPILTARVIRAVQAWQFEPGRDTDGQPTSVVVEMPIVVERMAGG